ncbi:hypothetical protein A3H65_03680 [Candidatus Giovannonibacteria bacterium RIFCSPLOWO2_02_FULL_45_14]|uniref:Uncharacterized protein n=1 Tax=Candidatus Giovannonibacteria bacterium RIFCSPLOWO2_12_FULL_44_15 TaxID=1798364 RepID=A0A1F5Y0J3_9BACT|nr:MAG: hypothetical protein A3C75_03555 [Candidatus Giovannonibacteria bacterium RIFCSPHIGHO2_02_FULL_44_31]OGF75990.1 MAG: hypothetical protein A3E62_01655 [Candidatus Giovannonibacteria bacterium RIFCSPHIGHO2_12_FULL_44_29]OGF90766.1 MAG: hypothetical protein A3H65_03680 [Candidatus Giovannonibacteria bacterium RIFCSPLOWO2_02_FULL_45_14]OGF93667.1 MAG: hypothetical protein A3G54_03975 [Candidatus Giovannonibacteria bacterium RIFCSPLOWO2_12_FULL_44_15]
MIAIMNLRRQKMGNQKSWTLEELAAGLGHFYKEHGRYPTATEVDTFPYLPSARSIERSFGGLVSLRQQLNLKTQLDFRSGAHSSERAHKINKRGHETEQIVYEFLKKIFGKEFVHREYFFTDDRRTRADFFVYDTKQGFCTDVFYPNNRRNLIGCLNHKLNKYRSEYMRQYPVIFLQMNNTISQEILDKLLSKKKKALLNGQYLMSWDTFQNFCKTKRPLKIAAQKYGK